MERQAASPARKRRRRRQYVPPPPPPPIGVVRQVAGTTIIILAVCLLGFGVWLAFLSGLQYDRAQHTSYADFRAELAEATAPTGPTDPANPKALLASGAPVAVLNIPALGMNAVVFQGTSPQVLENGPGHLRDSQMPGQPGVSVIFGRRTAYGGPFGKLGTLNPGAAITVTTGQGVATYTVLDLRRGGDPAPAAPAAGEGRLILVTADGFPFAPTGVLRVDASLTSKPFSAPTMILGPRTCRRGRTSSAPTRSPGCPSCCGDRACSSARRPRAGCGAGGELGRLGSWHCRCSASSLSTSPTRSRASCRT